jgi:hypothetical protein
MASVLPSIWARKSHDQRQDDEADQFGDEDAAVRSRAPPLVMLVADFDSGRDNQLSPRSEIAGL